MLLLALGLRCISYPDGSHPPLLRATVIKASFSYSKLCWFGLVFRNSEKIGHFRNDVEQIRHNSVIRNLKNRRLLILIDGYNDFGVFHAG